jgi:hypothetical protein
MPGAAIECGAAEVVVSLEEISGIVLAKLA